MQTMIHLTHAHTYNELLRNISCKSEMVSFLSLATLSWALLPSPASKTLGLSFQSSKSHTQKNKQNYWIEAVPHTAN